MTHYDRMKRIQESINDFIQHLPDDIPSHKLDEVIKASLMALKTSDELLTTLHGILMFAGDCQGCPNIEGCPVRQSMNSENN